VNTPSITDEQRQIEAIAKIYDACVTVNLFDINKKHIGHGSGIVYQVTNGNTYVVTNEHVAKISPYVQIAFVNGDKFDGELLASDVFNDLAIIRINDFEAKDIATFGKTETLKLGQTVIAIGSPFYGAYLANTVTLGIVSGHRIFPFEIGTQTGTQEWEAFLQIDASIGKGNSGGALINLEGEVVGINTWGISQQGFHFMNFAIPSYIFSPVIHQLQEFGKVTSPPPGILFTSLGEKGENFRSQFNIPKMVQHGVVVHDIAKESFGEVLDIQKDDVIIHVGNVEISDFITFRKELFNYHSGDEIKLTVIRAGQELLLAGIVH